MKIIFQGYDLTRAVAAEIVLTLEPNNNEDRAKLLWKPNRNFLENVVRNSPAKLTCFHGKELNYPEEPGCFCQSLYLANKRKQVIYLGTLFNKKALDLERLRLSPESLTIAEERGVSTIILDRLHCIIPSKGEINDRTRLEAVKRYFSCFPKETGIPNLAHCAIFWLSTKKGTLLSSKIWNEAEKNARSADKKEFTKKFLEDETW